MNRLKYFAIAIAACAVAACSAPRINATRLGSADLVVMTDTMAQSILASPIITSADPDNHRRHIVIDRAVNRTNDVIPQRELWAFLARLQARLAESPGLRGRGIRFVLPAERAAELAIRDRDTDRPRIPPTHAMTATFYSATTATRTARTDAYLCHFQIIDLATDALAWQGRHEVKYGVMRNKLD